MTTKTNLTALALALAAFTTASLIAGGASAKPLRQLGAGSFGTGAGVNQIPPKQVTGGGSLIGSALGSGAGVNQIPPPKQVIGGGGNLIGKGLGNGVGINQIPFPPPHQICPSWGCNGYPFPQPKPTPTHGGGDDDHHHRWGWGWGHGYGYGAPVVIEGVPAQAPVAVAARTSAPGAEAPCNCLSKQDMPDGSVVFQDICAKQSWVVPPQIVGAR